MFVEDKKLVGGFSFRAIRERLSGEARKDSLRRACGFRFE